ncbi:replication-relaxation family protein [Rhodococcus qingshengii]|uniref:replication-relaxation family protein n=1 Tax=Rhodococcus qingshengii TaxID=334542 RepID=UPI0029428EB8|nr:replication-relaxation family protein [Rhodococcus qingshengii]WOI90200.1 replication-relaxation family protein [Rhodococcus qingshengii]
MRQVSRFGQLSSAHLRALEFHENSSSTPCDRVLLRMHKQKLLRRITTRRVGGWQSGSGHYVYQLGAEGWRYMRREGKPWAYRSIDAHMLAIADCYVAAVEAERAGDVRILDVLTEPETWLDVAGADLRPDMRLDIGVVAKRANLRLWLEIDQGTERRKQLTDKIARYRHAYRHWTDEHEGEVFPLVLFVAIDNERARELRTLIKQLPDNARGIFDVVTAESFPQMWK